MRTFQDELDQTIQERKIHSRLLSDTLLKQIELNSNKKKIERIEENQKVYQGSPIPHKDIEGVTCRTCQKSLPVWRFKGNNLF